MIRHKESIKGLVLSSLWLLCFSESRAESAPKPLPFLEGRSIGEKERSISMMQLGGSSEFLRR
jgi:hypothetical protein